VEDGRELVHEGDVEVALRVLDHLGRLGHLDRGRLVQACSDDRTVNGSDDVEGARVLPGNDLPDGLEAVRLVARVDALGGVADGEIASGRKTRGLLQDRHAVLLRRTGIDGRLVDHDVASLECRPHRLRCPQQRREVGPPRGIDGSGNGHNEEIGSRDGARIGCQMQVGAEVLCFDLAGTIASGLELGNARFIDVEANDRSAMPGKRGCDGQTYIAKTDDGKLSTVRHYFSLRRWRRRKLLPEEIGSRNAVTSFVGASHVSPLYRRTWRA